MTFLIIGLILWIIILVYNALYSFLPANLQGISWVKICAIIVAIIILIIGVRQSVQEFRDYKFVYVSAKDGSIIKGKNFKWKIFKSTDKNTGDIIFIIDERHGDASDIIMSPDRQVKFETYNAVAGVGIRFKCPENQIPDFKIEIKE